MKHKSLVLYSDENLLIMILNSEEIVTIIENKWIMQNDFKRHFYKIIKYLIIEQ